VTRIRAGRPGFDFQ